VEHDSAAELKEHLMKKEARPPRWAVYFLTWYCRPELLEDLQGDLNEYFHRNLKTKGTARAKLIYIADALKFLRIYTIRKPESLNLLIQWIMLGSYFKTSSRNMVRNKLFSGINILGLAISMSVGLMLIAFVAELKSYDTFHKNYSRTYRVINTFEAEGRDKNYYASTSVLAGKMIQESVSGVEDLVIMREGFDTDLHIGDKTVPLHGIWAGESFFNIFSFDVLSGNTATALKELNSVVLTETSAKKLFGHADVAGKQILVDTVNYTVTAVIKDPPMNSHLRFDMLGSFITIETAKLANPKTNWMKWDFMWQNYVYVLLPENHDIKAFDKKLELISVEGNKHRSADERATINLHSQPLSEMVLSADMSNQLGPNFNIYLIYVLSGLAFVVMISACFNYANLSIARALRRTREVGIRKVVGATKRQVFNQFVIEAVIIAVLSLVLSFLMFLVIRPGFISMDRTFQEMVLLQPTVQIYAYFILLAIGVGVMAGFFPALFFSRINTAKVLKDFSSIQLFRHINVRKTLIVFQYTLSIAFIVAVSLGYRQYKYSVAFDLGLTTANVLNIQLLGNQPDVVMKEFAELPEVKQMSKSIYVTAVGMQWSGNVRYNDPTDSSTVYYNYVDENFIQLHGVQLLAGENFKPSPAAESNDVGVIINEKLLKWMNLNDPQKAIGEEIFLDGEKVKVVGVVKNFHHSTIQNPIDNFVFRYYSNKVAVSWGGVINLKVQSDDLPGFMTKLEYAWKKADPVHPIEAKFYDDKIKDAYDELSGMVKIIGFLAFLAISIASMGLLGMVVFTTETRLKEISIRKVMGASEGNLIVLMSRGFILLLALASLIAIPSIYLLFDQVIFSSINYRAPIGFIDLFAGTFVILAIAMVAISSQTVRVARVNPATTLRNE
jgi:putative ABC transport system permease protein